MMPSRAPLLLFLAVSLLAAPLRAKDRDRERFELQPTPVTSPEANQIRMDADQAYQRGEYQRVIEICDQLLSAYPEDNPHVAYHLRASARIEIGRQTRNTKYVRDGIADARAALAREGKKHSWLFIPYLYGLTSLAELERRPEHAELAIKVIDPVLKRPIGTDYSTDDKANLLYQRALAQLARNDTKAALSDLAEAIHQNPLHLGARIKQASTLAAQKQTAEAAAAYDQAVEAFPNLLVVVNDRGTFRRATGDLDGAIADFTRALEIDPNFAVGFINRGMCFNEQNNTRAAEADFTQALALRLDQPMQLLSYRMRAMVRVIQGRAEAGISDLTAAIRIAPQEAALYEERGYAHFFAHDFAAAAANLSKALELNPQLTRVTPWIALSYSRSGKTNESQAALEASFQAKVQPNAWVDRVNRLLAGQISEEELVSSATDLSADGRTERLCEAYYFLGQKKLLASQSAEAADLFKQAVNTQARPLTAYRAARYELRDFDN